MTDVSPTDAFYSQPNEIAPSRIEGATGELLYLLLSRLRSPATRTVLPARIEGSTRWYGLAPTDREARLLREELRCWLGPPISTRTITVETSSDPVDRAALRLVPAGAVLRVDVADGWQADARNNVASLTDVWALAPERGIDEPRPVGRVLRQFYESLLAGDRTLAEAALDEIRSRALLSPTNIRFLRVELLSALGSPQEMRDDSALRGISLLARPPAVTEQLAAAANVLIVEPALSHRTATTNWTLVGEQLEDAWPGLIVHREQVTTQAGARCLALRELVADEPAAALIRELAARFPDDPVLNALAPARDPVAQPGAPTTALGLYHQGDYWAALRAAESEAPVRSSASIALAAAVNLADSASAVRALAVINRLSSDDQAQLLATSVERALYDQLLASTSQSRLPADWLDWLRGDWTDRPDLLAQWARQWPRRGEDLENAAGTLAEELLDALNDRRRGRIRNGLPVFVEWIVQDGLPPSGVALATTIFDILLSSEPGRTERQASLWLLEEALLVGCTSQEYAEFLGAVSRQLPLLGPRDAAWLAQCLDLFLLFASPDTQQRSALFAEAVGIALAWTARLEPADIAVLRCVFDEADIAFPIQPALEDVVGNSDATKRPFHTVGIYSLLENATRVATKWIQELFPNVEIRSSSGHVNSGSLSALARSSDVMLVQTSRAKHAATDAINAASSDPSRLVLVHGRGATALVRALLAWAQGDRSTA